MSEYVFLTPSWIGDVEYFARLRRSMDRLALEIDHYVVVHTEDVPAFRERFRSPRRMTILSTADVLPADVERARASTRARFSRYDPRRYVRPRPIAGWYTQMFVKLAFSELHRSSPYVCVDSDLIVLREPGAEDFIARDGAFPIYCRDPLWVMEAAWFVRACELMSIPRERLVLKSHTLAPQLLVPEIAAGLCKELSNYGNKPWYRVMIERRLAEYEAYAAFGLHRWAGTPRLIQVPLTSAVDLTQWQTRAQQEAALRKVAEDPEVRYFVAQSKLPDDEVDWHELVASLIGDGT